MKNIFKAFLNFIKNHKIWSVIIILIILGVVWYLFSGSKNPVITEFVLVEKGIIKEQVSVTGNVKPLSDVDLAFERGGRVAQINVVVGEKVYAGEVLAYVSNADLVANLAQAEANLKKIKASFGNSADQVALELAQSKNLLVNAIRDSYTKSDDALRNKVYSLFNDPNRYGAKLAFVTDTFLQEDIEDGKDIVRETLDSWQRSLEKLEDTSDLNLFYLTAQNNLNLLKDLLDKCAEAVNGLTTEDATQINIDTWKANISTARTSINTTISSLTTAYNQFKTAGLSSRISVNNTLAEEANIEQAQAGVDSARAELAKTIILSPIYGVVTDIPIKLGEIIPANQKALSVISYGDYQVESFVPEADISKIKLGNMASTTLDAYGSSVNFATEVIKIDPAATVIDGVPTYKVTSKFVESDERIRSGMTANLEILTAEKENILTVLTRAVYIKDNGKYVKILNSDNTTNEIKVTVGLRGSDGKIEIISGLNEGDKVSTAL
jgi:RND family efflux transporter MFP subunit